MPASRDDVPDLPGAPRTATRISRPSRGFSQVARMPGDSGSGTRVCTARGHSWS